MASSQKRKWKKREGCLSVQRPGSCPDMWLGPSASTPARTPCPGIWPSLPASSTWWKRFRPSAACCDRQPNTLHPPLSSLVWAYRCSCGCSSTENMCLSACKSDVMPAPGFGRVSAPWDGPRTWTFWPLSCAAAKPHIPGAFWTGATKTASCSSTSAVVACVKALCWWSGSGPAAKQTFWRGLWLRSRTWWWNRGTRRTPRGRKSQVSCEFFPLFELLPPTPHTVVCHACRSRRFEICPIFLVFPRQKTAFSSQFSLFFFAESWKCTFEGHMWILASCQTWWLGSE